MCCTATGEVSPGSTGAPTSAPFLSVIQGAQRQEGLLPLWRKEDKVWLELSAKTRGSV